MVPHDVTSAKLEVKGGKNSLKLYTNLLKDNNPLSAHKKVKNIDFSYLTL